MSMFGHFSRSCPTKYGRNSWIPNGLAKGLTILINFCGNGAEEIALFLTESSSLLPNGQKKCPNGSKDKRSETVDWSLEGSTSKKRLMADGGHKENGRDSTFKLFLHSNCLQTFQNQYELQQNGQKSNCYKFNKKKSKL